MMPPPGSLSAGPAAAPSSLDKIRSKLASQPTGSDPNGARIGLLRELRAEIQDLQVVLHAVRKGQTNVKAFADYINTTKAEITELMIDINTVDQSLRDGSAAQTDTATGLADTDNLRHLNNLWQQMQVCPLVVDPSCDYDSQVQLNYLDTLDDQIRKMVYVIASETIPSRLNDWLEKAQPGYYVPFHLVFEDELPTSSDRVKLLNALSWSPRVIRGGIVDAASGLIYRFESNQFLLWLYNGVLAVAIVLSFYGVRWAASLDISDTAIVAAQSDNLLLWWSFVLIGVLAHMIIGTQKRAKATGALPPIYAVSDLGRVINTRIGQILMKLLLALVGFFAFVAATPPDDITPFACLLVGYSLDSIIEVFGTSLEQKAAAQVDSLKSQLKIT